MLRSNPCDTQRSPNQRSRFVLYVEGPSDSDILRSWARLLSPRLSKTVAETAVILGGRRPARAVAHFQEILGEARDARGICVLDRDGHDDTGELGGGAPEGLEFYTWRRRHIESYLLVPTAMRRCMRMPPSDPRLAEMLFDLPLSEGEGEGAREEHLRELDAKRLLAQKSTLARELGTSLSPARIARCMSRSDLHEDVIDLMGRLGAASESDRS